jgi:Spy/CpxP family protein refolding chaperone
MKRFSTFKTAAALVFALAMFGSVAMAQSTTEAAPPAANGPGGHGWGHRGGGPGGPMGMFSKLNLTADQKTQMKAVHTKYAPQVKELMGQIQTARQAAYGAPAGTKPEFNEATEAAAIAAAAPFEAKLKALHMAEHNDMLAVLTPEQKTQLAALQTQMKANMAARRQAWQAAHPQTEQQ